MIIQGLKIDRFRNLADTNLKFSSQGQIILGDNGQGKTNLLEAIYYLTIIKSFRGSNDSECVRFGEDYFNLKGEWLDDEGQAGTISVGYDCRRKKVVLSGQEIRKLSEAFGAFKSIVLTPDDISIAQGGPAVRRKYLDIVLSIISPLYLISLKRYKKALETRNFLLRDESDSDKAIYPWERQIADAGAYITRERFIFIQNLSPFYEELFNKLSAGERGRVKYRSSLLGNSGSLKNEEPRIERIRNVFEQMLEKNRALERSRGMTISGPQTDELIFEIEGMSLRNYGSQGQQRTAVISLKLAEAHLLEKIKGIHPVLLLDDIFAELDRRRCSSLLEELLETHQSFITAPRKEAIFEQLSHLPVNYIRGGVLSVS